MLVIMKWSYLFLAVAMLSAHSKASDETGGDGDGNAFIKDLVEQVSVEELVDLICECKAKGDGTYNPPRDCYDIQQAGNTYSGLYDIYPAYVDGSVQVYCDMDTAGGGWTVFQRREDGLIDFYRGWESYKEGFGYTGSEFWLGNDNIFAISNQGQYELRIDLEDFEEETRFAHYAHFRVGDETTKYQLVIGAYDGDAGDSFTLTHSGMSFTTKDQDNDKSGGNCAEVYTGAWWYEQCHDSNLNGQYLGGPTEERAKGVVWLAWKGHEYSLKRTEMKMRPVFKPAE